ncbi:hypothetical protein EV127DRAFT_445570 [Xylaria flabelliformis]|nr:hypothetical protein EV127DRAFT_445570 [Xylaria flabelliformis]
MAEYSNEGNEPHQIGILVRQNINSAKVLLSSLATHKDHYSKAASQIARFKLWAGSLGAHRRSGRGTLDYRLRDASSIRQHVVMLLDQLGEAIRDALSTSSSSEIPAAEARNLLNPELMQYLVEDDESNQSSLDMALDDIGRVVDCMLRLSVAIRNPAPHDQFMSRAGLEAVAHYEQYDIRHVQEKFTRIEDRLAERMGAAITARRLFFKYREDHHARLSSAIDDDDLTENSDQTTQASSVPGHLKGALNESTMIDSDVQSVISATSYASSSTNIDELRVPPIPKEYLTGPFLCPFCYLMIKVDSRNDWKKHVFRDLQPYVCLASSCLAQYHRFSRRSDWFHHMKEAHWRLWRCYCGCQEAFDNAEEFHCHLQKAHPNDLTIQQQDTFGQICCQVDLSKAVGPCPLCAEAYMSSATQYGTHVGQHLEQLALFALPQISNENDETESQKNNPEEKNDGLELRGQTSITASSMFVGGSQTEEQIPVNSWERFSIWDDQEHKALESPQTVREGAKSATPELPVFQQDDTKEAKTKAHDGVTVAVNVHGKQIGALQEDRLKWRWTCCNCPLKNLSYNYDVTCPGCDHRRDDACSIWAIG